MPITPIFVDTNVFLSAAGAEHPLREACQGVLRDAVHAGTMLHHGIARIVSTDTDFDALREITRIPPSELGRG